MPNHILGATAPTRRRALIAVVGPALLSACGGGGSSDTPSPADPGPGTPPPAAQPPVVTQAPADASVVAGGSAVFSVAATSQSGVTYQWLRNGEAIAGATAASVTYAPVSLLESGSVFSARVGNAAGSVTSVSASLTVTAPALTLIAGSLTDFSPGPPQAPRDGVGAEASFGRLGPLAADDDGNLYVASVATTSNTTDAITAIRKVAADGTVTPFAGVWGESGSVDAAGQQARFFDLVALSFDRSRKLLLAIDRLSSTSLRLCEVSLAGVVTTRRNIAATAQIRFTSPSLPAAWPDGTLLIAGGTFTKFRGLTFQLMPTAVFKLAPDGTLVLVAGDPQAPGVADGPGASARFSEIRAMAADRNGNVYLTDEGRLRRIAPDGSVTTIQAQEAQAGDGQLHEVTFGIFDKLAVDDSGNVLQVNNTFLRRIAPGGRVATIARFPATGDHDLALGAGSQVFVRAAGDSGGGGGWVGRFAPFPA